jgi:hypothetical protein
VDVCSLCEGVVEEPRLTDPVCHPACLASRLPGDAILALIGAALLVLAPPIVVWAG